MSARTGSRVTCPACRTAIHQKPTKDVAPAAGDMTICPGCAIVLVFIERPGVDVAVRVGTQADWRQLPDQVLIRLAQDQRRVRLELEKTSRARP